jgi:hypothetical protein
VSTASVIRDEVEKNGFATFRRCPASRTYGLVFRIESQCLKSRVFGKIPAAGNVGQAKLRSKRSAAAVSFLGAHSPPITF